MEKKVCFTSHHEKDKEKYSNFVNYSDVAGIRQMQFIQDIDPMMVLNNYYDNADI